VVEAVEEQVEEVEEQVEEVQEQVQETEDLSEIKVESLEGLNELNELLVQTDAKNDEKAAEQAENIKNQIEEEKNALVNERAELEAYRAAAQAELAQLQAQLDEIEDAQEEVVEEAPVQKKKVFKPTFEQVVAFAKSLQEEDWKVTENIKEDTGLGTIKFSKGKVQFLILQSTSSDYRITFLATEKKWSTILTGVKGVSIPKNAKGNKWLKYVNKGIGETSVIKSFIRESVKGANEEIANILKAKEEEKQRRAEAKKLAKKQAQEENK
jgi:small-conductance mechanosensitive channel